MPLEQTHAINAEPVHVNGLCRFAGCEIIQVLCH